MTTIPANDTGDAGTADHLVVSAAFADQRTGALLVHKDLVPFIKPYEYEAHTGPVEVGEVLGDVESWAAYVKTYAIDQGAFCAWNSHGLRAVLDYPERRKWSAIHPFHPTPEFAAWMGIATGSAVAQQRAVEFLDDHAPDIFEPPPADLLTLLRNLRANVNTTAETQLRADGTTAISFSRDTSVRAAGSAQTVELPPEITIAIPVLRGHVDADGRPIVYKLVLKLRASVDDHAKLALRLTMPQRDRVLEEVYADRVQSAKALLGDDFHLLRAAD